MIPIRDEGPKGFTPFVNYFFVLVNILLFFLQPGTEKPLIDYFHLYGTIPAEIAHPIDLWLSGHGYRLLSLISGLFVHGDLSHLLYNMLYLWIFGDNIEYAIGHRRYFIFYLISGVTATLVQIGVDPASTAPVIGASGAISAVMGAYLIKFPRNRVSILFFFFFFIRIIKIPALLLLSLWFLLQAGQAWLYWDQTGQSGVAWFAHLGGFIAGLILVKLFEIRSKRKYITRGFM